MSATRKAALTRVKTSANNIALHPQKRTCPLIERTDTRLTLCTLPGSIGAAKFKGIRRIDGLAQRYPIDLAYARQEVAGTQRPIHLNDGRKMGRIAAHGRKFVFRENRAKVADHPAQLGRRFGDASAGEIVGKTRLDLIEHTRQFGYIVGCQR